MNKVTISYKDELEILEQLCIKIGLPIEHSKIVADALTAADLRGVDTHGIRCFEIYSERYKHGSLNITPNIRKVSETEIAVVLDGDNALGHITSTKGMEIAIEKAKKRGIGIVCVRNSNHFGAAAYYSMKALSCNFIGMVMTNATARMAPTGGITPSYGNNPWSIAVPSNTDPFVIDMSLSVVAGTNLIIAKEKGIKIPFGWATTKEGEPTEDSNLAELLLPIGGYKGYAIALVVEVLSGILSGSSFGKEVGFYNDMEAGQGVGHFLAALDVEQFMSIEIFKKRMNKFMDDIKSSRLAKGVDKIYIPGEKKHLEYQRRLIDGIAIDEDVIIKVNKLCTEYGISTIKY